MILRRTVLRGAAFVVAPLLLVAFLAPISADVLQFPDGFVIQGQVKEKMTYLPTPQGAISIPKPGVPYWLDDGVRKVWFPPFRLRDASKDRTKDPEKVTFKVQAPKPTNSLPASWVAEKPSTWNDRWERQVPMKSGNSTLTVTQRITGLTPDSVKVEGVNYKWDVSYSTKEFDPDALRSLLYWKLDKDEALKHKELDKRYTVYRFLFQAGFIEHAEEEAELMLRAFPQQTSEINGLLDKVRRVYAIQLVEGLQRSQKAGLHNDVANKLAYYDKKNLDAILDERTQLQVQAIKDKLAATKEKIAVASRMLQAFANIVPPGNQRLFQNAAAAITSELNADTVDRLETFLALAGDYQRAVSDGRKPDQKPEEVMAFAMTGWLRGSSAAERDVGAAARQWEARELLLRYLRSNDLPARKSQILPAILQNKIGVDDAMQIIRMLPPVEPFDKLDGKLHQLQTSTDGKSVGYHVLVPPGYHHGRGWPVMIALHHSQESSGEAAARWAGLAAQHGYVVMAPQWGKGGKSKYQFSTEEHMVVLESLRDLRRRFNVDSDRVFLFGAEQGGTMAFDVGLAHPDLFAGVMPMAGTPQFFAPRYWPNARHVNLYIINGELAGSSKATHSLFSDFIKASFPAIFVEYKGRPAEWFGAEAPILFDWMNCKRRTLPMQKLGLAGQEFTTQRASDNQFYWIGCHVAPANVNSAASWNANTRPATVQASVYSNNEIHVKTSGISQVTLWFVPGLVNYGEPVAIRVNNSSARKTTVTPDLYTLLETLHRTADRQRMFFAAVDLKMQ